METICKVSGCENYSSWNHNGRRGLCAKHYVALMRTGVSRERPPNGSGTISKCSGYRVITVDGKQVYEHRHIMEQFVKRKLDPREEVHHKNEIKTDNAIENLEIVDISKHRKIHYSLDTFKYKSKIAEQE